MLVVLGAPAPVAERVRSISAGLLASTVTPGSTAPVVSLTAPEMPAVPCARAIPGTDHSRPEAMRMPKVRKAIDRRAVM